MLSTMQCWERGKGRKDACRFLCLVRLFSSFLLFILNKMTSTNSFFRAFLLRRAFNSIVQIVMKWMKMSKTNLKYWSLMKSILHDIWQDDEIKVLTGLHYKTLQPPLQALVSVVTSADLEPVEASRTALIGQWAQPRPLIGLRSLKGHRRMVETAWVWASQPQLLASWSCSYTNLSVENTNNSIGTRNSLRSTMEQ